MPQTFKTLFPTSISQGKLKLRPDFNQRLKKEIFLLSKEDKMGQAWSKENYVGGYTSYASLSNLHQRTPLFMELEKQLAPEVKKFAKHLGFEMRDLQLEMNACWMNIMPSGTYHTLHFHPHSVISGAYYVDCPKGSVALKLEDPRMAFYMNLPLKKGDAAEMYYKVPALPGSFILFESWLRHEVPPNQSKVPRVSVSFNYSLVDIED